MSTAVESDDPVGDAEGAVEEGKAGMVFAADGCLWRAVSDSTNPKTGVVTPGHREKITDCLIDVRAAEKTDRGFEFAVEVTRTTGEVYRSNLNAKTLEKCADLNAWALSTSMSNWNLTQPQRIALKRYLFAQKGAKAFIHAPGNSGYLAEHGIMLAMNSSIDADGMFVEANPSGTFTLKCRDEQIREFRVDHLQNAPNLRGCDARLTHDELLQGPPALAAVARRDALLAATDDIQRFCARMHSNLTFHSGTIGLGWLVANLFYTEVQRSEAMFPILYIYGERGSGKDTLAGDLMDAMGLKHIKAIPANKGTNPKALRNMADQVGSFPLWINEMRAQDPDSDWLLSQIRTWFDGQGGAVATLDHKTKTFAIRRGLMLSGQSLAGADAEMSRYVVVRLRKKDVVKEFRTLVMDSMPDLKRAFLTLMAHRNEFAPGFAQRVIDATAYLHRAEYPVMGHHVRLAPESRQAVCWGTVLAGISVMWGMPKFDAEGIPLEIRLHVMAAMRDAADQANQEGTMGAFWDELESQFAMGELSNRVPAKWCETRHNSKDGVHELRVWTSFITRAYVANVKKAVLAPSFLRAELEATEGYITRKSASIGGVVHGHVDIWDADKNSLPEWVNDLARGKTNEPGGPEDLF